MQLCPCGTGQSYLACCGAFIEENKTPSTPEALMRSRYTAYTKANTDYLLKTMKCPLKIDSMPNYPVSGHSKSNG